MSKQESSPVVPLSPAVAKAAGMLDEQMKLAQDLDAALQRASEARDAFEREGAALEAFLRTVALGVGLAPGGFEYHGGERFALWVRGRGLAAGFAPYEEQQLDKLRKVLRSTQEMTNA